MAAYDADINPIASDVEAPLDGKEAEEIATGLQPED